MTTEPVFIDARNMVSVAELHAELDKRLSEKAWQAEIVREAKRLGWICYHTHDSRRSTAGFPDLICVRNGRLLALEFKREGGRVDPKQLEWLAELEAVPGVTARLVRPSDRPHVMAVLAGGKW